MKDYPHEISFIVGIARVYDMLNDSINSHKYYRYTLTYESSNLEAVANIGAHHFYID